MSRTVLESELSLVLKEIEEKGYPSLLTLTNASQQLSWLKNSFVSYENVEDYENEDMAVEVIKRAEVVEEVAKLPAVISALRKKPEGLNILKRIRYQQLISVADEPGYEVLVNTLLRQGFIEEVEIRIAREYYQFYILSLKGASIFDDSKIWKKVRTNFPNMSVPRWLNSITNDILLGQAALIYIYLSRKGIKDYITFRFDECGDLLFACEIVNSEPVYYCVMGVEATKDNIRIDFIEKMIRDKQSHRVCIICMDTTSKTRIKELLQTKTIGSSLIELVNLEVENE